MKKFDINDLVIIDRKTLHQLWDVAADACILASELDETETGNALNKKLAQLNDQVEACLKRGAA